MAKKIVYAEPSEYIPKSIRKELGIGEFAKEKTEAKTESKAKTATSKKK